MTITVGSISTTPTAHTPGFYDPNQVPTGTETQKELGRVDAVLELNGVLYVGGDYSTVFDNSTTGGGASTLVSYISAWRMDTWKRITTWNVTMPGRVYALTASPDGSHIAIGGASSGFKVYKALTDPTDTSAPSAYTTPSVTGSVQAIEIWDISGTVTLWVIGNITAVASHSTVALGRMTLSGTTYSVDAGLTCAGCGGGANVKCGVVKSDGSIAVLGGDFSGAVLAFDGGDGSSASWGFNFTTGEGEGANQSCISMAADDNMVAAGGDFGPNIFIVTDWTGSGPNNFTNISGGWSGYWSHTCDGNVQALAIGQMNGSPVIYAGHHGTVAATAKNAPSPATSPAATGFFCVPWTTTGGDRIAYGDPPVFANPSNTSTPLKVWSLYQSTTQSGTLHVGGDFTSAVKPNVLNSQRRYASFAAQTSTTNPPPPPPSGTVTVVQEIPKKLTTAAGSFTISLATPATPGNTLLLAVSASTVARRGGSVSDDASNTWVVLKESGVTSAGNALLWWAQDVTGGQTVTFPWSTGTSESVAILQELSGIDPSAGVVGTAVSHDYTSAAGSFIAGPMTTSDVGYVVAAVGMKDATGDPFTSLAGWNESTLDDSQNGTALGLAGILENAAGAYENVFTANSGTGAASTVIAALPVASGSSNPPPPPPPPSQKPVFGFNSGTTNNNVWTPANTALGGIAAWRGYLTPAQGIPSTYPGGGQNVPTGVTLRVPSYKPDVPTFINGTTLDAAWTALCKLVPAGDWVTLWHEGESQDGWTPAQILALHKKAYDLAKAANPNLLYGQIFVAGSALSGNPPYPLGQWVAQRSDGGPLDFYGLDCYAPNLTSHTLLTVAEAAVAAVQAVVPTAKFAVTEANANSVNATGGHTQGKSDPARAAAFRDLYSYAVTNNFLGYFPFFFVSTDTTDNYPWDAADTATIAELSAENADSKTGTTTPPTGPTTYTIPADGSLDGMYLSVLETAADSMGNAATARSNIVGPIASAGSAPINTAPPGGNPQTILNGAVITWTTGTWSGSSLSYATQVQIRPTGGADSTIANVSGATTATSADVPYTTLITQVGFDLRLEVAVTNTHGTSTAYSTWTTVIPPSVTPPVSPTITMTSPAGDVTVVGDPATTQYTVVGNATSDTAIATMYVNGDLVTTDGSGNFTLIIPLVLGANLVTEVATDEDGDTTTDSQMITLQAPVVIPPGGGTGPDAPIDISGDQERIAERIQERGVE